MKRWTPLLLLPVLLAACSKAPENGMDPAAQTIEVAIGSGPRVDMLPQTATRTTLDEDGVSVKWQTNDRLALWAVNSAAQTTLEAATFSLYHYNEAYNTASFRGTVPAMPEDTYTYYAVSPVPAATDGLKASYDIPAVQDGAFHGEWDVMVATPIADAAPLREHDRKDDSGISDNTDIVNLRFAHKTHVLKITLPKNDLGEPITEIVLTFPAPVVGRLTVDATDPAAEGTLSNAGEQVTLRFAEPKDAGDVVYAMIAPVTLDEGQQISIVASSESRESETRTFAPQSADRTFAAGHTTPINYNVPVMAVELTRLTFHLAETGVNTLGEAIDTFTVTAPEGWVFEDGNSSRTFDVTGTGDYTIRYRGYPNPTNEMSGFRVTYDSEHALLSEDFTMPALSEGGQARVEFNVPWLLYETFDQVPAFSNHDNAGSGLTTDTYTDAIALDGYNLPGWSGTRCGADGNNAFRICVRTEDGWLAVARYHGRVDSRPLTGIKSTARVKVSFNYSIDISRYHTPLASWGYHTTAGLISGTSGGSTALSPAVAADITGTGGSYSSITESASYYIDDCTAAHRLAWDIYSSGRRTGNSNGWLYLDNIKVQIVQ